MTLGPVSCLLPLTAFVLINKYGWGYTNRQIIKSVIIASIISFLLQSIELTMFSVMFIPAGYMIAHAAQNNNEPWRACFKGALTLSLSLFVFFSVLFTNSEVSFFGALTEAFNHTIEEALQQYRQSGNIASDSFLIFEKTLNQIKVIIPIIIPALLINIAILISWLTLVLGNTLSQKLEYRQSWPLYRYWSLPEKLIWVLITAAILAISPEETLSLFGLNMLVVLAWLYFFQGLAIVVFLLHKWNIPRILRSVIYFMIIFQSFGTIILLGMGIADVWFDLRRQASPQKNDKKETE